MNFLLPDLKALALQIDYTFKVDPDGTERMIRPDGTIALIARPPSTDDAGRLHMSGVKRNAS